MERFMKIFVAIMLVAGIIGGIILLLPKKKQGGLKAMPAKLVTQSNNSQAWGKTGNAAGGQNKNSVSDSVERNMSPVGTVQTSSDPSFDQWAQCRDKKMSTDRLLTWDIAISNVGNLGEYYAQGSIEGNAKYPVQLIVKSNAQNPADIKGIIASGKTVSLRGVCNGVETDGSVIFEATN